jgi:hypothetical protein
VNIILAFLIFILCVAAGNLLIARRAWSSSQTSKTGHSFSDFIELLGASGIVILLTPTTLLLYWGWISGFLWLALFTLFAGFLLAYCFASNRLNCTDNKSPNFLQHPLALICKQFILIACIGFASAILTLLIQLQSGIWFVLLGSLLAIKFAKDNQHIPGIIRAFICLIIGVSSVLLGTHIGVSFFGEWQPIPTLEILRFDNSSLTTIGILSLAFYIASQDQLQSALSKSAGVIWLMFFCVLLFSLLILLPSLEAPMHNLDISESNNAPPFIAVCVFISAPLLFNYFVGSKSQQPVKTQSNSFGQIQIIGLSVTIFVLLMFLILASGTGIGSWKTHYLNWPNAHNLIEQFTLVLDGVIGTLEVLPWSQHTIILSTFMLAFCTLVFLVSCLKQISLIDQQLPDKVALRISQFKLARTLIIIMVCLASLEYGFSLSLWIVIGMLSWNLLSTAMLRAFSRPNDNLASLAKHNPHPLYLGICLALCLISHLGALALALHSVLNAAYVLALVSSVITALFIKLQWHDLKSSFLEFSKPKEINIKLN